MEASADHPPKVGAEGETDGSSTPNLRQPTPCIREVNQLRWRERLRLDLATSNLERSAFMFTRLTMLLAVCLLISLFSIPDASACTGRPYATDYKNISEFEIWVRATVIDRDDLGFNAILRVEEYYKGDGPRLLVVDRHPRALESVTSGRGYSNGCMGNGGGQRYRRGATGYFGLRPRGDGTYKDWIGGSAHFIPRDGVITYFEDFEWLEISESDFVAKLLAIGGREAPSEPIAAEVERYPLMRYLMVTTERGTRFQVNPDRSVTPVPDVAPLGVSPDGAHWVHRLDENTLGFGRPYTSRHSPEITYFEEITGREFRFSNDSNLVAVWDSSQLVHLSLWHCRIQLSRRLDGTESDRQRRPEHRRRFRPADRMERRQHYARLAGRFGDLALESVCRRRAGLSNRRRRLLSDRYLQPRPLPAARHGPRLDPIRQPHRRKLHRCAGRAGRECAAVYQQ